MLAGSLSGSLPVTLPILVSLSLHLIPHKCRVGVRPPPHPCLSLSLGSGPVQSERQVLYASDRRLSARQAEALRYSGGSCVSQASGGWRERHKQLSARKRRKQPKQPGAECERAVLYASNQRLSASDRRKGYANHRCCRRATGGYQCVWQKLPGVANWNLVAIG